MLANNSRGRDSIRVEVSKPGDARKAPTDPDVFVGTRRWTPMQRANEAAGAEHSGRPCRQEAGGRWQELTRQKSQSRRATGRRVRPARVLRGEQDVTAGEEHRSQERTWSKIDLLPLTLEYVSTKKKSILLYKLSAVITLKKFNIDTIISNI